MTGRTWSALQARGRRRWTTRTSPPGANVAWTLLAEDERVMTEGDAIVYVVEDDASLRASLQDLLESVGLRVAACVQRCPAAWCSMCGCQASAGWSCLWTALLPTAVRY